MASDAMKPYRRAKKRKQPLSDSQLRRDLADKKAERLNLAALERKARRDLARNAAQIEATYRGVPGDKPSTWRLP